MTLHPLLVKSYYNLISSDKIRFLVIGGVGFVINYVLLAITYSGLHLPIHLAQIISTELALVSTFIGNNYWAFKGHHHISIHKKFLKFQTSALAGLLVNYACQVILVHYAHMYYGLALAIGTLAGLIWNYFFYKKFVFKSLAEA
jgi:putative flippase GtrA